MVLPAPLVQLETLDLQDLPARQGKSVRLDPLVQPGKPGGWVRPGQRAILAIPDP